MLKEYKENIANFKDISIELVKSFWDIRPCNVKHSPKPIGSREYFNEVEERRYFVEPHIKEFADFHKWSGKTVLEIGCGIGTDTINFARSGALVTALDVSEKSLELARKRAEVYGLQDKIHFYLGNIEELTSFVPIQKFDLIYSFGVIHHTPCPEKAIEQIKNYVHSESILKLMVYNRLSWKVFCILMTYGKGQFWKIPELVAKYSEAQEGCPVTYTYNTQEISMLLKKYGFKVEDIKIEHIFPYKISDYVKYCYKKVWYFRFLPKSNFRFLEKKIGWHICVTASPIKC